MTREETIQLAQKAYRELAYCLSRAGIAKDDLRAALAGMTIATILDGLAAVNALVPSNGQGHAPSIARGMIEALVDLVLICKSGNYADCLLLRSQQNTRIYVQHAIAVTAAFKECNDEKEALIAALREVNAQITDLEARGARTMEFDEKLTKSDLDPKMRFYWARWIASSHNNFDSLLDRHWRDGHLQIGDTLPDEQAVPMMGVAIAIACEAMIHLHRFSSARKNEVETVCAPLLESVRRILSEEFAPSG
jgi:hypothetical protein